MYIKKGGNHIPLIGYESLTKEGRFPIAKPFVSLNGIV